MLNKINEAKNFIETKTNIKPEIGIILGSGLGDLANNVVEGIQIPYNEIPHFMTSSAIGHSNELVIGKLNNKNVVLMKGRFHFYEGYDLKETTFPVRVLKSLGVKTLIITNSCGAINLDFNPGELMLITDHLNMVGINPLIGHNIDELGPRFPDASNIYKKHLQKLVKNVATELNIKLNEGVYAWWSGPSYETPAEIKMLRTLGADAVGMSTVPEALIASHANMDVIGVSCLTNMASGILDTPLSHSEVVRVANEAKETFEKLILNVVNKL